MLINSTGYEAAFVGHLCVSVPGLLPALEDHLIREAGMFLTSLALGDITRWVFDSPELAGSYVAEVEAALRADQANQLGSIVRLGVIDWTHPREPAAAELRSQFGPGLLEIQGQTWSWVADDPDAEPVCVHTPVLRNGPGDVSVGAKEIAFVTALAYGSDVLSVLLDVEMEAHEFRIRPLDLLGEFTTAMLVDGAEFDLYLERALRVFGLIGDSSALGPLVNEGILAIAERSTGAIVDQAGLVLLGGQVVERSLRRVSPYEPSQQQSLVGQVVVFKATFRQDEVSMLRNLDGLVVGDEPGATHVEVSVGHDKLSGELVEHQMARLWGELLPLRSEGAPSAVSAALRVIQWVPGSDGPTPTVDIPTEWLSFLASMNGSIEIEHYVVGVELGV